MANLVGIAALSHSPSWDLSRDLTGPGKDFVAAVERLRKFNGAKVDAIVLFGPDHYRNFFYDVLPQFCIGVEKLEGYGDYDSPSGPLPCAQELGRHILGNVMADGFDPAVSLNMSVDHGHTQPYAAVNPTLDIPLVPIMINCQGGPRPTYRRVADFGRAVGDAIRSFPEDINVIVMGSGGLSHFLPKMSADDEATPAETRDYIINGRERSREVNAEKERVSKERRAEGRTGKVSQEWDAFFLNMIETNNFEPLHAMTDADIEAEAGNGAHELRSWVAAAAAWGRDIKTVGYEAVPTWITGMGVIGGGVCFPEEN
jgi:2,3-dihydroxyphenylpropionate 1,2-dioxygenase